jgi:hypothetical protein
MGLPLALRSARDQCGGPLEVFLAAGHGRSYGMHSTVLGRTLPGITQCGLWQALDQRPGSSIAALITDVGNDLLYEQPVEQIAAWVEQCLERLQRVDARIVVTRLPLVNLETLSPRRYAAVRSLFFPRCRLNLAEVCQRAHQLDQRLGELAMARGVPTIAPRREWYGLDPIHVLRRRRPEAWREILSGWTGCAVNAARDAIGWHRTARVKWLRPERRWLLGREQCSVQPAARWSDGESIAIY